MSLTVVERALEVLRAGGLVAIPTETVYGLAADASNEQAVRRIFAAKGRPADHPLIVHIASAEHLPHWASSVPAAAAVLADACWPGPLTVVLRRRREVPDVVTAGCDSLPKLATRPLAHASCGDSASKYSNVPLSPTSMPTGTTVQK